MTFWQLVKEKYLSRNLLELRYKDSSSLERMATKPATSAREGVDLRTFDAVATEGRGWCCCDGDRCFCVDTWLSSGLSVNSMFTPPGSLAKPPSTRHLEDTGRDRPSFREKLLEFRGELVFDVSNWYLAGQENQPRSSDPKADCIPL